MTEAELLRAIRLRVGQMPGVALWRNQSELAEHGWRECVQVAIGLLRRGDAAGALRALSKPKLRHARAGLCVGASDLVGIVAPHGRFLALEVKAGRGRLAKEQVMFLSLVNERGGVGREVRTVEDAEAAVEEARR